MILYLDSSALVKRYVAEPGSAAVADIILRASMVGTALLSRVEVAAAFAKANRAGTLRREEAVAALNAFQRDWPHLARLFITESAAARAAQLAWDHGLRGYDAVHLAAALIWQDGLDQPVAFATFDRALWSAARTAGLPVYPDDLPGLVLSWQPGHKP